MSLKIITPEPNWWRRFDAERTSEQKAKDRVAAYQRELFSSCKPDVETAVQRIAASLNAPTSLSASDYASLRADALRIAHVFALLQTEVLVSDD